MDKPNQSHSKSLNSDRIQLTTYSNFRIELHTNPLICLLMFLFCSKTGEVPDFSNCRQSAADTRRRNRHPIAPLYPHPNVGLPLTPGHLLIGPSVCVCWYQKRPKKASTTAGGTPSVGRCPPLLRKCSGGLGPMTIHWVYRTKPRRTRYNPTSKSNV